jgi:hypothetical protein
MTGYPAPTRVDFTDINNGTINGRLTVSVTGGTINYDAKHLILYDAMSLSAADISILGDLTKTSTLVVTPEPGLASLLGIGLVGLMLLFAQIRAMRTNPITLLNWPPVIPESLPSNL